MRVTPKVRNFDRGGSFWTLSLSSRREDFAREPPSPVLHKISWAHFFPVRRSQLTLKGRVTLNLVSYNLHLFKSCLSPTGLATLCCFGG